MNRNVSSLQSAIAIKSKSFQAQTPLTKPLLDGAVRFNRSTASSSPLNASERSAARVVPSRRVFTYRITASGTTFSSNTSFPTANTSYTPETNFQLPGAIVIEPRIAAQNAGRNGANARDVTFVIGNDASLTAAGTLRYSTNTLGHRHWGGSTSRPAIDTAFVSANNRTSRLNIRVDPQWSRNDTTNLFSWRSSLVNAPKQILAGSTTIRFTNRGRRISGSVTFYGNGFIEPGAYAYTATFRGNLFQ